MKTATPARRTRPARPFGEGILTDEPLPPPSERTGWGQPMAEALRDGSALRAARKAKGLTQAELGKHCGVSGSLVGQMERAEYPITVTFRRLARTWVGEFDAEVLPPLSGGSDDFGVMEPFCSDCDSFHEPFASFNPPAPVEVDALDPPLTMGDLGYRAAFSAIPRCYAPYGPGRDEWLAGWDQYEGERGGKRGPTDEDMAYEHGRTAFLGSKTAVQPPAGLSTFERLAFLAGVSDESRVYHERGLAEHEARRELEMAAVWAD